MFFKRNVIKMQDAFMCFRFVLRATVWWVCGQGAGEGCVVGSGFVSTEGANCFLPSHMAQATHHSPLLSPSLKTLPFAGKAFPINTPGHSGFLTPKIKWIEVLSV